MSILLGILQGTCEKGDSSELKYYGDAHRSAIGIHVPVDTMISVVDERKIWNIISNLEMAQGEGLCLHVSWRNILAQLDLGRRFCVRTMAEIEAMVKSPVYYSLPNLCKHSAGSDMPGTNLGEWIWLKPGMNIAVRTGEITKHAHSRGADCLA